LGSRLFVTERTQIYPHKMAFLVLDTGNHDSWELRFLRFLRFLQFSQGNCERRLPVIAFFYTHLCFPCLHFALVAYRFYLPIPCILLIIGIAQWLIHRMLGSDGSATRKAKSQQLTKEGGDNKFDLRLGDTVFALTSYPLCMITVKL